MITAVTSFEVDADSYEVFTVEEPRLYSKRRPSDLEATKEKSTSELAAAKAVVNDDSASAVLVQATAGAGSGIWLFVRQEAFVKSRAKIKK